MRRKGWCKAVWKLPGCCTYPQPGALTAFHNQRPVCTVAALLLQARAMTNHHFQFLSYQLGLKHNPIPEGLCLFPIPWSLICHHYFFKGHGSFKKKNIHFTHFTHFVVCQNLLPITKIIKLYVKSSVLTMFHSRKSAFWYKILLWFCLF